MGLFINGHSAAAADATQQYPHVVIPLRLCLFIAVNSG